MARKEDSPQKKSSHGGEVKAVAEKTDFNQDKFPLLSPHQTSISSIIPKKMKRTKLYIRAGQAKQEMIFRLPFYLDITAIKVCLHRFKKEKRNI